MSDLVQRLLVGEHPAEVSLRPERTVKALKECLDRGYVHVRFTGTRGGTELGVPLDTRLTDFADADFDGGEGHLTVVRALTLDYVKVRCVAKIILPSMEGHGHLELIAE